MRSARLCQRQSLNIYWTYDMKRMIEILLKAMRALLSRFGGSSRSSSSLNMHRSISSQPGPSLSSDIEEQSEFCKSAKSQPIEPFSDDGPTESGGEDVPAEVRPESVGIHIMKGEVASKEESPVPAELDVPKVSEFDAASEPEPSLHDGSSAIEKKPVADDGGCESDLKNQSSKEGVVESQAEAQASSEDMHDTLDGSALDESNGAVAGPATNSEISSDTQLTSMPLGSGSVHSNKEGEVSIDSENLRVEGSGADIESLEEEPHHIDQHGSNINLPLTSVANHEEEEEDFSASTSEQDLDDANPKSRVLSDGMGEDQKNLMDLSSGDATVPAGVDGQVARDHDDIVRPLRQQENSITSAVIRLACESTKGASSPRRPAPREDAGEYKILVRDVSAVDQEYARWNRVIVEQLLLAEMSAENVYLCVNPRILARVYGDAGFDLLTPDQAEQRFSTATAQIYRKRVLEHSDRLHVLRRCGDGGFPDCAGFLAASVLAAYRMQSDEEVSGNAYYKRLADLLGCGTQGVHPVGFDPAVFESLWMFLHNWLREVHGRRLAMPRGDVGFRRFVALPLAHVPLRSLDVDKLPAFFSWAGYQPGGRVRHDRLLSDLRRWQQARNALTPTGAESLSDDRSDAVAAQVSAELESWDGSFYESESKRTALVEVQFDVVQRSPVFFYLPRRPPGFPEVFDGGERVFEASEEGWYDPAQVRPEDGELLGNGFEWPSNVDGVQFMLRRPGAVVVALTPSSICSGFLSNRRLLRGVRCSVLVRNNVLSTVQDYLSEVAQSALNPVSHPLLPNGWAMFRDFTARVHIEAPPGLEALEVDPNVELIIAGGLRVGRRWSWLAGAPPRILVSGVEEQDSIKVNDAPVEVGENGELPTGAVFAEPGEYIIEAGRVRRRIEIAQPQVSVRSEADRPEPIDGRRRRIALPHGSWTLIGPSPDQVSQEHGGEFFRGTIASCPFQPSWAIQVGAGPGAVVAALASPSPPRTVSLHRLTGQARRVVERWTSAVYEAHIRRPRFIGLGVAVPDAGAVDTWRMYAALAKEIKRSLKRRR